MTVPLPAANLQARRVAVKKAENGYLERFAYFPQEEARSQIGLAFCRQNHTRVLHMEKSLVSREATQNTGGSLLSVVSLLLKELAHPIVKAILC